MNWMTCVGDNMPASPRSCGCGTPSAARRESALDHSDPRRPAVRQAPDVGPEARVRHLVETRIPAGWDYAVKGMTCSDMSDGRETHTRRSQHVPARCCRQVRGCQAVRYLPGPFVTRGTGRPTGRIGNGTVRTGEG
jgi:hypothetical protein